MLTLSIPAYTGTIRLRGYNGPVGVISACTPTDAGRVLRRLNPHWTKQEHIALADQHAKAAEECAQQWNALADAAAMETFGRKFSISDYRISAIASEEFSEDFKQRLRELAHAESRHSRISAAHRAASRYMRNVHQ